MKTRIGSIGLAIAVFIYVTSYVALSRMGTQRAATTGSAGFYFCEPTSPLNDRMHLLGCTIYYPLWKLDQWLTGNGPASIPTRQLSRCDGNIDTPITGRRFDDGGAMGLSSTPRML